MTKYEVVEGYNNDKVRATVWWNGKRVESDDASFLDEIKDQIPYPMDKPEFLQGMSDHFKNGYLYMRRAK